MMTVSRLGGIEPIEGDLALTVHLYPPDNRRRDADNCLKCLLDSIAHAGAMRDDSQIKILHVEMLDPIPGGQTCVIIEARNEYEKRRKILLPEVEA